ncbi:hypothetical protein Tco_0367963 [Tanacetum coccineum]
MDSIISLGQKNTLAEYMILSGADNRPPMLDKELYDSWKSRMELYMQNREHGRMILESIELGPLIWPTVEENGVIRTKKYAELSVAEKIQAGCDMKATNIILQGLPADIYSLVNHHRVAKDLWERVQLLMQGFAVPIFSSGDDPIACLNNAMAFLTAVASLRSRILADQAQTIIPYNAAFQTEDLDTYDSDCEISTAEAVLMANISIYGSNIISDVPNSETYLNDMDNQKTLILEEESRSKMSEKAKDPEVIAKKISHKPIDYEKLNSLTDDFEKRFSPQQELSAEQAFWFHILNPSIESSYTPPVIVEVPSELPKVSLVNASLKKLKFHLTQFDSVVKKRTTPNALEEGKEIVENVVHIPSATTITPGMFKLDLVPLPPRLLQNREVHIDYLRNTQEQANILREIFEQAKAKQPLDGDLDLACKYATRI